MTVYIDRLRKWGGSKNFKWKNSCHMYADTAEELHKFAEKIGMQREWFQDGGRMPHYDLTRSRRKRAIKEGAVAHTDRQMMQHVHDNDQRRKAEK